MTAPRSPRYRDVFAVGEFQVLFAAHVVSILGDVVAAVALMVTVYARTHSPALAAATMSLVFVPYLFGGALLSAALQRWPARRTLVVCHICSAVLVAVMAAPGLPVAALLILLFVVGLFAPVFQGVRAALLPKVLPPGPPYVLGRSLMRMVAQSAQIVGYGAGGLLLAAISARGALAVDALSFALSAALVRFGTAERSADAALDHASGEGPSLVRASLTGVRRVFAMAAVWRVLFFGWAVPACAIAPEALAAPYVAQLGQPARSVGWYLVAMPLGTVVADVVAGRMLGRRAQARVIVPCAVVTCASLALFATRPGLLASMGVLFAVGLGFAYAPGLDQRLIDVAPDDLRPTALAVNSAGLMFVQGVGFATWGIAAELVPIRLVISVAAAIAMTAVLALGPAISGGHPGPGAARSDP